MTRGKGRDKRLGMSKKIETVLFSPEEKTFELFLKFYHHKDIDGKSLFYCPSIESYGIGESFKKGERSIQIHLEETLNMILEKGNVLEDLTKRGWTLRVREDKKLLFIGPDNQFMVENSNMLEDVLDQKGLKKIYSKLTFFDGTIAPDSGQLNGGRR